MRAPTPALVVLTLLTVGGALGAAAGGVASADERADDPTFSLVTVTPDGEQGNGFFTESTISGNGRFVVFTGAGDALAPGGASAGGVDVLLRDLDDGVTRNITKDANERSRSLDVSGDGSRVLFSSVANSLVRPRPTKQRHLYVWRRGAGIVQVDLKTDGRPPARGEVGRAALSANGRWVVFLSTSPGLVSRSVSDGTHLYRHDLRTGRTTVLDARADGEAIYPDIDGDGRTVVFASRAGNLADGQHEGTFTLLAWREGEGLTNLTPDADGSTYRSDLSRDGSTVAVETSASLDPTDTHAAADIYVIDVASGDATWLTDTDQNAESFEPTISDQGRWVAFASYAALSPDDTDSASDPQADVYLYRRGGDGPELVSTTGGDPDEPVEATATNPTISGDGSRLVFLGYHSGLVDGFPDGGTGLILADLG